MCPFRTVESQGIKFRWQVVCCCSRLGWASVAAVCGCGEFGEQVL